MKRLGICFGISGLLLGAACSSDPEPATGGAAGSGGSAGTTAGNSAGGSASGSTSAGSGGMVTAGSAGKGGGGAGGTAGAGGAAGAAGTGGASGAGGGAACDGKTGKAMKFASGVNDMIAGDVGADIPSGDMPRTLELWAKFTSIESWTGEHSIIELGRPAGPDHVWGIDMSGYAKTVSDNFGLFGPYSNCNCNSDHNGDKGIKLANTAPDVGWLHLSWGYAGAGGKTQFTVNGEELPTQPRANFTLNITPGLILLGASQDFGPTGWDGVMDEVRIWKVLRTPAEIKANMKVKLKGTEAGLGVYYNFDEATGTDVADVTKTASRTLKNCTAAGGACKEANKAMATRVDSDIPGPFTCAP